LVDIRREGMDVSDIRGRVLARGEELVLLSVAGDEVFHNGFTVVRLPDITFVRWNTPPLAAWQRAVDFDAEAEARVAKAVDLASWETVIASASRIAPLQTFHREKLKPDTCYVGRDVTVEDGIVVLGTNISTDGDSWGHAAIALGELTRIDFLGNYEAGLVRAAEATG
jgi:hypothetical protein